MALVKCPECGRENVSSVAKACPGCGYNIKSYYESEYKKDVTLSIATKNNKIGFKVIICGVVVCFVMFCVYFFCNKCDYNDCTEKKLRDSNYCAYHSLPKLYGSSSNYRYIPKTGNAGAKAKAESYLRSSAFSYNGLIHQLEYNGFSESEATYGADHCNADWKEQAVKTAKEYLNSSSFSYSGLIKQLEYNSFTEEEAQYGVDNCCADWNEQAEEKAESYLRIIPDMSRSRMIDQLKYNGFTYEQAVHGAEKAGL